MTPALPDSLRRTARWLGYGGLIPFLVLAPVSLLDSHHGFTWSDALFAYGAVVGANYRKGMYYSGLDLRYLNTSERNNVDFENWALIAKVGINF